MSICACIHTMREKITQKTISAYSLHVRIVLQLSFHACMPRFLMRTLNLCLFRNLFFSGGSSRFLSLCSQVRIKSIDIAPAGLGRRILKVFYDVTFEVVHVSQAMCMLLFICAWLCANSSCTYVSATPWIKDSSWSLLLLWNAHMHVCNTLASACTLMAISERMHAHGY